MVAQEPLKFLAQVRFLYPLPKNTEVWQSPVYCTCLENRRTEMFREFESHRFRQIKGELAEWLRQQFAKLSFRKRRIGSNPILSAIFV